MNEPVEKVTFLKSASSAGSKIGNCFLSSKVFGSGNRAWAQLLKGLWSLSRPDPPNPSLCGCPNPKQCAITYT